MQTTVINLFGGPGTGKSKTAADVYSQLKANGESVELVREYVKHWAYTGRKIGEFDQLYLLGKQSHYESFLYGTVKYIVTDSPILLAGFYASHNQGESSGYVGEAAKGFIMHSAERGVRHLNFLLSRDFPYVAEGRYESEEGAQVIDKALRSYLNDAVYEMHGYPAFMEVGSSRAADDILKILWSYEIAESPPSTEFVPF